MKSKGVNITAETCPHYLTLSAEEVPNNGTEFKCAPPIRSSRNKVNNNLLICGFVQFLYKYFSIFYRMLCGNISKKILLTW